MTLIKALKQNLTLCAAILIITPIIGANSAFSAVPVTAKKAAKGKDKENYISQTYIDTIIQRAFENFNTEMSTAGQAEFKQRQVIEEAKLVIKKLRRLAKGNSNEKYILWKTGELEQQVSLEERELYNKEIERRQKAVNVLCDSFNIETGRKRPDFVTLNRIVSQMETMDPNKAGELDYLVQERNVGICKEIISHIEYYFTQDDFDRIRPELDYCSANRTILRIPPDMLSKWETRLQSVLDLDGMKAYIDSDLKRLDAQLTQNRFANVRNVIFVLTERTKGIRTRLQQKEVNYFNGKICALTSALERKEDSLVMDNLSLLESKGVDAARYYMSTVLYPTGVGLEKIGRVDRAVLERIQVIEQAMEAETPLTRELDAMVAGSSTDGANMDDMVVAAKKKAQLRADSVRTMMAEYARRDSIRTAGFKGSEKKLRENQEKANTCVMIIYDMMDRDSIAAASRLFGKQRSLLEKFIPAEAFATLENMLNKPYKPSRGFSSK